MRKKVLGFALTLIALSILGSTMSLLRITQVNHLLDGVNRTSVPLGRLLTQMQSDFEVFRRELDRGLGYSHWKDSHWRARPIPKWIEEIVSEELERTRTLLMAKTQWAPEETRLRWQKWILELDENIRSLKQDSLALYSMLERNDFDGASTVYPRWSGGIDEVKRRLQWATSEYEKSIRQSFSMAEARVSGVQTGLEIVLVVVIALSLLFLWLGERALRPLAELTLLARTISERGLKKDDKAKIPEIPMSRSDEVSRLALEFRRMAVTLLEREKTVEIQKTQLQDQNRLLRKMGELNENVLKNISSALIVTDLNGVVTQCNPQAFQWFSGTSLLSSSLRECPELKAIWESTLAPQLDKMAKSKASYKIEPFSFGDRIFGGHLSALRQQGLDQTGESGASCSGAIFVFEDLTQEIQLQQRLAHAENLAAVGRMSAQVAHEIRNPLHSIGLEAEMALETATGLNQPQLKQSIQSILQSVDRLEDITQNYLKLSRLSVGEKTIFDVGQVLESVLATYANTLEEQKIHLEWSREPHSDLRVLGDVSLIEQAIGNLLRNSIQALQEREAGEKTPKEIHISMGSAETGRTWIRVSDNGSGVSPQIRDKLFTPFATSRSNGTGLGLSFVKKVVEDHSGSISLLDSCRLGGACFEVILPSASLSGELLHSEHSEVSERENHA